MSSVSITVCQWWRYYRMSFVTDCQGSSDVFSPVPTNSWPVASASTSRGPSYSGQLRSQVPSRPEAQRQLASRTFNPRTSSRTPVHQTPARPFGKYQ